MQYFLSCVINIQRYKLFLFPNSHFQLPILPRLLQLTKYFFQYFRLPNLTMVSLDLDVLSGLPNLSYASFELESTATSLSTSNEATAAAPSKSSPLHFGVPGKTMLLVLPCCSRLL